MLQQGAAARSFALLRELKVLDVLLPRLALDMEDEEIRGQVERIFHTLDNMSFSKKGLSPSLLMSLLYFPGFNAVYAEYFAEEPPTRSALVSDFLIDILVEIECVAYKPV